MVEVNDRRVMNNYKFVSLNLILKMKVTVIGAGAVGASCTEYIAMRNFAS